VTPLSRREQKQALRRKVLKERDALNPEEHRRKSARVCAQVVRLPDFAEADTVMLFASFGSEVNTWPLIDAAIAARKSVVLPAVVAGDAQLVLRYVSDRDAELRPGKWGILEPLPCCPQAQPAHIDFILLPGVAFDETGGRIGYGGGYYDCLLNQVMELQLGPTLVAVAFELQIATSVPQSTKDMPVPTIVTQNRVIRCKTS
jgi:5-formyltetrahydrofolate cyclo-ligase